MGRTLLVLADGDPTVRQALETLLQEQYQVRSCQDGKTALALLRAWKPDLLVLDLMLPQLDGISLLSIAWEEGIRPVTLAMTELMTPYVLEATARMNIAYIIRKPCDLPALVQRLGDLESRPEVPGADVKAHIASLLRSMGFNTAHKGYLYLIEAIVQKAENPSQSLTKELYPAVAALCSAGPEHVEHSIRTALEAAWEARDPRLWATFFQGEKRPSNGTFIKELAKVAQNWMNTR